jgi:hypothetical protein
MWDETIAGKPAVDHQKQEIRKYNTNIAYQTRVMFSSLLNLPVSGIWQQTARARLVKSPDERYYYRAYPGARSFSRTYAEE